MSFLILTIILLGTLSINVLFMSNSHLITNKIKDQRFHNSA